MRRIQDRGRLIAGVDQNTLRLSYLNPLTGRLEGFEIDLVRELARQLLGDPHKVDFRVVTSAQRIPAIQERRVDMVADAFTITCDRRRDVAFSTPYLDAGQRLLVRTSSPIRGLADLNGRRVCATTTSTSMQNIRDAHVGAIPYPVAQRTDCLVALQEGAVGAVTSDDAILLGFQVQDPYTKIVGPRFSQEPYGIGIDRSHPDFVRFVNGALARMRADGTWTRLSDRWLAGLGGAHAARPPEARYAG
jgi:polar amino acid transport system substrate-binding protein